MNESNNIKLARLASQNMAEIQALKTFVFEIAVKLGVDSHEFSGIYDKRVEACLTSLLSKVEDGSPFAAAKLDTRAINEIPTDPPPPLFPN